MSTNRGIFESFPNQPANRPDSPFAVAPDSPGEQAASPFSVAPQQASPFTVVDEAAEAKTPEFGKPVKLPERRKTDSPFQVAEPSEGFGFEAPAANPFEAVPAASPTPPFSAPAQTAPASPFSTEPARPAPAPVQAAIAGFTQWQEPQAAVPSAFAQPARLDSQPQTSASTASPQTPATPAAADSSQSDSFNIRQLELRAIFGVDREMNADEILQRARALPGMRNIARLSTADMATIDSLKNLLPSLGFGSGALRLYSGSVPLEFIREGSVMLAVQTDGGFAPGVRETLMIIARELGRMA